MDLVRTYTFYLRDGREESRFEPTLCLTDVEALGKARQLLARHPECDAVEAYFGDTFLFRVAGPAKSS